MAPVLKVFGVEYSLFGLTQLLMFIVNLPPYTGPGLLSCKKLWLFISQELLENVVSVCLFIHPEPANTVLYSIYCLN